MKYLTGQTYKLTDHNSGATFFIDCILFAPKENYFGQIPKSTGIHAWYVQITNNRISLKTFDFFYFIRSSQHDNDYFNSRL